MQSRYPHRLAVLFPACLFSLFLCSSLDAASSGPPAHIIALNDALRSEDIDTAQRIVRENPGALAYRVSRETAPLRVILEIDKLGTLARPLVMADPTAVYEIDHKGRTTLGFLLAQDATMNNDTFALFVTAFDGIGPRNVLETRSAGSEPYDQRNRGHFDSYCDLLFCTLRAAYWRQDAPLGEWASRELYRFIANTAPTIANDNELFTALLWAGNKEMVRHLVLGIDGMFAGEPALAQGMITIIQNNLTRPGQRRLVDNTASLLATLYGRDDGMPAELVAAREAADASSALGTAAVDLDNPLLINWIRPSAETSPAVIEQLFSFAIARNIETLAKRCIMATAARGDASTFGNLVARYPAIVTTPEWLYLDLTSFDDDMVAMYYRCAGEFEPDGTPRAILFATSTLRLIGEFAIGAVAAHHFDAALFACRRLLAHKETAGDEWLELVHARNCRILSTFFYCAETTIQGWCESYLRDEKNLTADNAQNLLPHIQATGNAHWLELVQEKLAAPSLAEPGAPSSPPVVRQHSLTGIKGEAPLPFRPLPIGRRPCSMATLPPLSPELVAAIGRTRELFSSETIASDSTQRHLLLHDISPNDALHFAGALAEATTRPCVVLDDRLVMPERLPDNPLILMPNVHKYFGPRATSFISFLRVLPPRAVVIGTTQYPLLLAPEVVTEHFSCHSHGFPDVAARQSILERALTETSFEGNRDDIEILANKTEKYGHADLQTLVDYAVFCMNDDGRSSLCSEDITRLLEENSASLRAALLGNPFVR